MAIQEGGDPGRDGTIRGGEDPEQDVTGGEEKTASDEPEAVEQQFHTLNLVESCVSPLTVHPLPLQIPCG